MALAAGALASASESGVKKPRHLRMQPGGEMTLCGGVPAARRTRHLGWLLVIYVAHGFSSTAMPRSAAGIRLAAQPTSPAYGYNGWPTAGWWLAGWPLQPGSGSACGRLAGVSAGLQSCSGVAPWRLPATLWLSAFAWRLYGVEISYQAHDIAVHFRLKSQESDSVLVLHYLSACCHCRSLLNCILTHLVVYHHANDGSWLTWLALIAGSDGSFRILYSICFVSHIYFLPIAIWAVQAMFLPIVWVMLCGDVCDKFLIVFDSAVARAVPSMRWRYAVAVHGHAAHYQPATHHRTPAPRNGDMMPSFGLISDDIGITGLNLLLHCS